MNAPSEESEEQEPPRLVAIAKAVSDGQPVDWEGMRQEEPEASEMIERLRFVAEVAEAHRRVLDEGPEHDTA